nr:linear gramicidin synthase subunit D [uncultured bacterium]
MKRIAPSNSFTKFGADELEQSIPERFERIVAKYPNRVALRARDCAITYKELNETANRLARTILKHCGPEPGPVAVLLGQNASSIVAILAVLKAGKFYVPLDPGHPRSRNSHILVDAQTSIVIGNNHSCSLASELLPDVDCLNIDAIDRSICANNIDLPISADALAYVIYTSGSTGQPKGVMQSHRNVLHKIMVYTNSVRISPDDRLALIYSYSSAGSVRDIFAALLNGALLLPYEIRNQGWVPLADWLMHEEITVYNSAATVFRHFARDLTEGVKFPKLRLIHLGSETIYKGDVELYKARFSDDCVLIARLGSTEISPIREYAIHKDTEIKGDTVPAGYAVDETEVLLLDDNGSQVGLNETGEIAVKSSYIFPGYWRRPDLTQDSLITDPRDGKTIFKTGDLGRMLPDGCLQHLGRKDFQVKIRGYRVEIEEIESVLTQHPEIQEAAVHVPQQVQGETRLVAYIVPRHPQAVIADLREFIRRRLPDYMVPSEFVVSDALPRTPNGKLDRGNLPIHAANRARRAITTLETPVETVVARIWKEVLGIDDIGGDSNFFEIGGDSLLAMQVISRVGRILQVDCPLRILFETLTVSRFAGGILSNSSCAAGVVERAQEILNSTEDSNQKTVTLPPDKVSGPQLEHTGRKRRANSVPLSLTQEQMWFVDQLSPGNPSYNMAHAAHLKGVLKISLMERSINEIVRRHESLRTTFPALEGVPAQLIAPFRTIAMPIVDLAEVPQAEREAAALRIADQESQQLFDLSNGPLVRFRLLRLAEDEHVLIIAMHHIIGDGWSWGIFLRELASLYNAFSAGQPSPLMDLPLQYADFAVWQRRRLQGKALGNTLSYWKKQLEGAPSLLSLPTDYPRPNIQAFQGAAEADLFSKDVTEKLKDLSRQEGVTLFMTLLAAFYAVLFRWTGQEDIVVGSTTAGRNSTELEKLIGLFINTLVLRTDLSGNPTFRELVRRVREVALGAYSNQEVPFDKLTEAFHSKRSLSKAAIFQVFFVLNQDNRQQHVELSGLAVTPLRLDVRAVKFDLFLSIVEKPEGLRCSLRYRTDLFRATTIRRMLEHFHNILEGVVANPDEHLSRLPMLSHAERRDVLFRWNATAKPYPRQRCVHELFEEQVRVSPNDTAVVFEEERLTYRELNRRANQLANHLVQSGVHPGTVVVLFMHRSPDLIVALFAILKAGAAYVPLDPKYSAQRLERVIEETEACVIVSQAQIVATLTGRLSTEGINVICVDSDYPVISEQPQQNLNIRTTSDYLAYVIYTSGSTGTPKGVEITHRAVVNFAVATASAFDLLPDDRILQFASISFDTATEEIFPCLLRGATLVLRTERMLESPAFFLEQCRLKKITVLDLPTVYWHDLTKAIFSENLALPETLRLVILGGDRALPERVTEWQKCSGKRVRLLNEYGPTETTVVATAHDLSGFTQTSGLSGEVPIGQPIANVQTYVLDRHLNPVPVGVSGELYIGGIGVSRGYHKRPDLTAECFIPDPFGDNPGGRLYKTGDLARYLPDGTLEFLGRLDHQVKVRGFRVEPAEIEAVLNEHAGVRQVVVVSEPHLEGDNRLVAYVVLISQFQSAAQELRDFLKKRLPDYMVPAAFVILDVLPLTASGKVDRAALPPPDQQHVQSQSTFVAPRTSTEKQLTEEWEQLLRIRPISIRDNFFDLGGHSLLGVRLIARIEKRFRKSVPVAVLFQSPTIEQLAAMLEANKRPEPRSLLIPIQTHGSKLPLFWIHGDSSNAVLPGYLGPDQPLYGIEHQSQDGQPARYTEVEKIAEHYLREVRSVRPCGPYLLGGYSFGAVIAFEMAQQLRKAGEQVPLLFMLDPPGRNRKNRPSLPLADQVQRHLQRLENLELRDKLGYLLSRLLGRIQVRVGSLSKNMRKLRGKTSLAMGHLLPPSVRSEYILDIYKRALRTYVPKSYSGPVTLFKTEGDSYQDRLNWIKLTTGDIEIHEGRAKHMDLRKEPYVRPWAQRLNQLLHRTQPPVDAEDATEAVEV